MNTPPQTPAKRVYRYVDSDSDDEMLPMASTSAQPMDVDDPHPVPRAFNPVNYVPVASTSQLPSPANTPQRGRQSGPFTPVDGRVIPVRAPRRSNQVSRILQPKPLSPKKVTKNVLTMLSKNSSLNEFNPSTAYQVSGRNWMISREGGLDENRGTARGGLLADEMGLGKTTQIAALLHHDKKTRLLYETGGRTLIVTLKGLILQLKLELKMYGLIVCIYHGPGRRLPQPLHHCDVIITTYGTLRAERRKSRSQARDERPPSDNDQDPILPDDQDELLSESTRQLRPRKPSSKPSPRKYTRVEPDSDGSGSEWEPSDSENSDSDSDYMESEPEVEKPKKNRKRKRKPSRARDGGNMIRDVEWHRIVLDESHEMRNRNSETAKACFELKATFRWCVTGTPLHNHVWDLFSIFHFLRIKPCNNNVWFYANIVQPLSSGLVERRKHAYNRLHVVLSVIMIRRHRDQIVDGHALLTLPPISEEVRLVALTGEEKEFYDDPTNDGKRFSKVGYLALTRARQASIHPNLDAQTTFEKEQVSLQTLLVEGEACQVCSSKLRQKTTVRNVHCDVCEQIVLKFGPFEPGDSAKMKELVSIVELVLGLDNSLNAVPSAKGKEKAAFQGSTDKIAVFSQFTAVLDIFAQVLEAKRLSFVRYDGRMSLEARRRALQSIAMIPDKKIILVSLMAGGVGLNLESCNHIVLLDPWWNPAIEEQAIGRLHRIGQTKPVHVYRIIAQDTVEARVVARQNAKMQLAKATFDDDIGIQIAHKFTRPEILKLFGGGTT
ncbi:P-loop containing nucleoside triphosphate hydrolase protein [Mycena floridula]|nr:P-loop containing nucleoside triphosphate hydrolase protein [Mycena floridula]